MTTKRNARMLAASERELTLRPVREPVDWGALDRIPAYAAQMAANAAHIALIDAHQNRQAEGIARIEAILAEFEA